MSLLTDAVWACFAFKPWSSSQTALSSGSISLCSWKNKSMLISRIPSLISASIESDGGTSMNWKDFCAGLGRGPSWLKAMIGFLMVWQWWWHEGVGLWHVVRVADPLHHRSHFPGMFLHSIWHHGCWTSLGATIASSGRHALVSGMQTHIQWLDLCFFCSPVPQTDADTQKGQNSMTSAIGGPKDPRE